MTYALAYLLIIIAALFSPILSLYAMIGLIIGSIVRGIITRFRTSHRFRKILLRTATAALIAGLIWLMSFVHSRLQPKYNVFMTSAIFEISYTAVADLPIGEQIWEISEQILLSQDILQDVKSSKLLRDSPEENEQMFRDLLISNQWTPAGEKNSIEVWSRFRQVSMSARWLPATTSVIIPVDIGEDIYDILIVPDEESTFTFRTPKHLIVSSFPPVAANAAIPGENRINLTVPAMYPGVDIYPGFEANITLEVLSPLFRWKIADVIANLSLWNGFKWLALLACGVFSDEIKNRFVKPSMGRLFTWPSFDRLGKTNPAEKS